MEHIYDVVIIGGGPAGYSAALYGARAGLDTLVIEKYSVGGQLTLTDRIDNYPGFDEGIDGITLGERMQASAHRFGACTKYSVVTGVDLTSPIKTITTLEGDVLAKCVVIASGAEPKRLSVAGEEKFFGRGVHYCAHCDGRFYKGKTVCVVGGGNSALSDALYLSNLAARVIIIHRRDRFRAERVLVERLQNAKNILTLYNCELAQIFGDRRVEGVRLIPNGDALPCDGVFISIGRAPMTDFIKGLPILNRQGYIVADETTKTALPGVFAAGDVRTKDLRQVVTAVSDGAVAIYFAQQHLEAMYLAQNKNTQDN